MELLVILRVLLKRWWIILGIPIIAAGVAFFFASKSIKMFKSEAQLATGFTTEQGIVLKEERFNNREAVLKFQNLIESIKSEIVVSMVTYRLILHDLEGEPFRPWRFEKPYTLDNERIKEILNQKLESFELLTSYDSEEDELLQIIRDLNYGAFWMQQNLEVKRIRDTDFVRVAMVTEDPVLSAFTVNTLTDEYIRYNQSLNEYRSSGAVEFFQKIMEEKKKLLDEKRAELTRFKQLNQVTNYEVESQSTIAQIFQYELQRQDEMNKIQALRFEISKLNDELNISDDGSNTVRVNEVNAKIIELRKTINELNKLYVDGGGTDEQLAARIENIRERLNIEMANLASLNNTSSGKSVSDIMEEKDQKELELQIAESNIISLDNSINTLKRSLSGYSSKEVTIGTLELEIENASNEHADAVTKYNEAKMQALLAGGGIKRILDGRPAGSPEPSKKYLLVALAAVGSGGLTVFIIILLEFVDLRIKTPNQFESATGLRLSGALNEIKYKNINFVKVFEDENNPEELKIFKQFLRKLRYEIQNTPEPNKTILITSTKENEGKSFLVMCLAHSLSLVQKKILIIDTNFKNNSLTKLLMSTTNDLDKLIPEQTEQKLLMSPELDPEEFKNGIVSPTAHKNIDIIGSNAVSNSPSEIFAGKDFRGMVEHFKSSYDYILMEGASLNNYSDTRELVGYADKVIPIFSAESTIKAIDKQSIGYLKSLNGKLIGAVLNRVKKAELLN